MTNEEIKEKFVLDGKGNVKNFDRNIAKMKPFEYLKYIDKFSLYRRLKIDFIESLADLFTGIYYFLMSIIVFIISPFVLYIRAKRRVRVAMLRMDVVGARKKRKEGKRKEKKTDFLTKKEGE